MCAGIWLRVGAALSVLVVVVLGGLFTASPAAALVIDPGQRITLEPSHARPTAAVKVSVQCDLAKGAWDVTITGLTAAPAHVRISQQTNVVTETLTVPADAQPGTRNVIATCQALGGDDAQPSRPFDIPGEFTVDPVQVAKPTITADPDSGRAGADVTLTAEQLPPCRGGWTVRIAGISQTPTVRSLRADSGHRACSLPSGPGGEGARRRGAGRHFG